MSVITSIMLFTFNITLSTDGLTLELRDRLKKSDMKNDRFTRRKWWEFDVNYDFEILSRSRTSILMSSPCIIARWSEIICIDLSCRRFWKAFQYFTESVPSAWSFARWLFSLLKSHSRWSSTQVAFRCRECVCPENLLLWITDKTTIACISVRIYVERALCRY